MSVGGIFNDLVNYEKDYCTLAFDFGGNRLFCFKNEKIIFTISKLFGSSTPGCTLQMVHQKPILLLNQKNRVGVLEIKPIIQNPQKGNFAASELPIHSISHKRHPILGVLPLKRGNYLSIAFDGNIKLVNLSPLLDPNNPTVSSISLFVDDSIHLSVSSFTKFSSDFETKKMNFLVVGAENDINRAQHSLYLLKVTQTCDLALIHIFEFSEKLRKNVNSSYSHMRFIIARNTQEMLVLAFQRGGAHSLDVFTIGKNFILDRDSEPKKGLFGGTGVPFEDGIDLRSGRLEEDESIIFLESFRRYHKDESYTDCCGSSGDVYSVDASGLVKIFPSVLEG